MGAILFHEYINMFVQSMGVQVKIKAVWAL